MTFSLYLFTNANLLKTKSNSTILIIFKCYLIIKLFFREKKKVHKKQLVDYNYFFMNNLFIKY